MNPPPLRKRIRNGTLAMLAIALILGASALPEVQRLGGAIQQTLYRNYKSIEAARHMTAALSALQIAERDGTLKSVLPSSRAEFTHWIGVEENDITEVGEAALAKHIDEGGRRLFSELATEKPGAGLRNAEFAAMYRLLDQLVRMNRDAMFRANSRAVKMGDRLTFEFAIGLIVLLLVGTMLSWTLARAISKPLSELADSLRSFSLRGPSLRLDAQPLAELQSVASEFNRMAERLERFEKLNVDRLLYEKGKTESIIESLEDGIVLIDPQGIVTHINETAALILGVGREDAMGCRFADLNSNHPRYLRIRAALAGGGEQPIEHQRVEVELYFRGRDHTYVLKSVPLRHGDAHFFGTILILQDVTYLRDKDRARANLVATLSHELKTPLTSLALSTELLERSKETLDRKQQELLATAEEDVGRLRLLADDLLDLARGDAVAITIRKGPIDLAELTSSIAKTFALQAEAKGIRLTAQVGDPAPKVWGDSIKLSWVFSNLVANALRYTPDGGAITISSEQSDGSVSVKVSDTGPGIPPEVKEHLFERFTQSNVNGAVGSAGLGLAIAKEIVEAHGGRIFVDSASGQGTCFIVMLPAPAEGPWPNS